MQVKTFYATQVFKISRKSIPPDLPKIVAPTAHEKLRGTPQINIAWQAPRCPCSPSGMALRGRPKNRTGYQETTQMDRTNKARLAVCSKAIVKQECLVFVFFSRLDGYNQCLHALPGLFVRPCDVTSAQCYGAARTS